MKRRKRKRSSKATRPAKIPVDAEKAASPSTALAEADRQTHPRDEFIAVVEAEEPVSPSVAPAGRDRQTHPRDEFIAVVEAEEPVSPSVAPAGRDRRTHPRYEFIAAVEVVAAETKARIETCVRDLSQQGCYVDTNNPLPLGTVTNLRITKGAQLFEARSRVVYSRMSKGMGLVFTDVKSEHLQTLETWVAESRETSWLATNRRRSQRVLMTIPVRISRQMSVGLPFEENTHTVAVSAHGALILVSTQVYRGQRLSLSNVRTKAALECVVAHIERRQGEHQRVGIEFVLPNPKFWHVAFPPKDWTPRHPDAKSYRAPVLKS
jgi:hypothetical protein